MADDQNWWDRFTYAATSFADRLLENGGFFDVAEEFAKYDDADMSATSWFGDAKSVIGQGVGTTARMLQQGLEIPFQSLFSGAQEINKFAGAEIRANQNGPKWWDMFTAEGRERMFDDESPLPTLSPYVDYFTGGISAEKREAYRRKGMQESVLRGRYEPITASDALIWSADHIRNTKGRGAMMLTPQGWIYSIGEIFNPMGGGQRNGSYLPAAFDIYAPDAGIVMWERSDMTHQLIAGQVVVESLVDPLNWAAGPIAAMIKGLARPSLTVGKAGEAVIDSVTAAQSLDLVGNSATDMNRTLRWRQWVAGRGTWKPTVMLTNLARNPRVDTQLQRIADTKDRVVISRWLENEGMAEGEGRDALASVLARLDDKKDVASLMYAAAYRDEEALKRIISRLEYGSADSISLPVANELKTLTGTGKNVLESTYFELGDGLLPDGHVLAMKADEFVTEAIARFDTNAGLTPDDPGSLMKQWDALAEQVKADAITDLYDHQVAMAASQRLLERVGTGEQVLKRVSARGERGAERAWRAAEQGFSPNPALQFAEQLRTSRVPFLQVAGRSMRTVGTVYLLAKPGLTFSLHGLDASSRYDGLIQYVDGIVGDANASRFSELAEVRALRDNFTMAGAVTNAPEEMRAQLVDQLQALAIREIAKARGIDPAAAQVLADKGMEKAKLAAESMNSVDKGYVSTVMEDQRPLFLKAHPTTIRQTANHIPIMDLKALDDALKARGTQSVLTMDGDKLSIAGADVSKEMVARAQSLIADAEKSVVTGMTGDKVLRNVGRSKGVRRWHTIVDMADEANTLFKISVLMRLGYPVRNLSEAHLSAFASGVGWLSVLSRADIPHQLSNFVINRANSVPRATQRIQVATGSEASLDTLRQLSAATQKAIDHQGDRIAWQIGQATNPVDLERLVVRINEGDEDAVQELRTVMEWRAQMTHELTEDMIDRGLISDPEVAWEVTQSGTYHHADIVGTTEPGALNRPISVVSDPVVAQTAADAAWGSAVPDWAPSPVWTPGALQGAGSFPVGALPPAQRALLADLPGTGWRVGRDGSVKFASKAGVDDLMGSLEREIADARDRAADLRDLSTREKLTAKEAARAERAAKQAMVDQAAEAGALWIADVPDRSVVRGMGTTVTKADDGTYVVREDAGWGNDGAVLGTGYPTQLDAKVAVLNGQARRPTGATQYGVRLWSKDGRSVYLEKPGTVDPDNLLRMPLKEIVERSESSPPMGWAWDEAKQDYARVKVVRMDVLDNGPGGKPVPWESHDLTANAGKGRFSAKAAAQREVSAPFEPHTYEPLTAVAKVDGPTMRQQAATLDRRAQTLDRARQSLVTRGQWMAREAKIRETAKTHRVQFRVDSSSPWVDWKPGATNYRPKFNPEFRTIEGVDTNPRRVQIDAWSPMIDLTDDAVVDAVIANYPDFPVKTLGEARAGDRAAQEKLMGIFAKEGFYRVKFPEPNGAWNGEHIMVHPDAVGRKAFERHVLDMMERRTGPDSVAGTGQSMLLSSMGRKGVRAMNRGMVDAEGVVLPAPLRGGEPDTNVTAARIFENGGYGAVMEESLETMRRLKAEQASLNVAYLSRAQKEARRAKRHGAPEKMWQFASTYGPQFTYRVQDLLHGPDGGAYSHVTAGTMNQTLVYAQGAHHADLMTDMARASMLPEEVHPGDPRFFEAMANFLGRHGRDTPGAVTPMGLQTADIDPVLLRAMQRGDREQLIRDTVDWALHTREGRDWMMSMDLIPAKSVDDALARADKAARLRRADIPVATTRAQRRTVATAYWNNNVRRPTQVVEAELADVIRAQFNFVDNNMPTDRVRDLFRSGQATAENLRAAYDAEPWQLHPFNGLLSPTHGEFKRAMAQRRQNQMWISRTTENLINTLGKGMQAIGTGPETMLARHPVFQQIGYMDLQQRIRFAEATQDGPLSLEQVLALRKMSQKYALRQMEKTLYTMKNRSSVDEFMRFIMPFFPAWRNTVHRWGRFAVENPAGVAQVARLYSTTVNQLPYYDYATGSQVQLEDGTDPREVYTLLPGISALPFMDKAMPPILKESMRRTKVNQSTWDVVFQGDKFNAGFGPLVAIGAQTLLEHHQGLYDGPMGRAIAKWFMPVGPQQTGSGLTDTLFTFLPSAAKPLMNQLLDTEAQRTLRNRVGATYIANGHDMNPDGTQKTKAQISKEIDAAVLKLNAVRIMSYLTSPVATQQVGDHEFYASQYRALLESTGNSDDAEALFLERFGPEKWLFKAPTAYNLTGGASTSNTVRNQRANGELAEQIMSEWDNPKALGFFDNLDLETGALMPYDPESYNPYARSWQLKNAPPGGTENYRGGKEFEDFQSDAQASLGWQYYDEGMDRVDLAMSGQGYTPGTYEWQRERAKRASDVAAYVGQLVPQWAESRTQIDTAKTERNADLFRWVINESEWGSDNRNLNIVKDMRSYLNAREQARAEIASRNRGDQDWPNTLAARDNADIAARLLYVRESLSQGSPTFRQWVDQFFRTDDVAYVEEALPGLSGVRAVS